MKAQKSMSFVVLQNLCLANPCHNSAACTPLLQGFNVCYCASHVHPTPECTMSVAHARPGLLPPPPPLSTLGYPHVLLFVHGGTPLFKKKDFGKAHPSIPIPKLPWAVALVWAILLPSASPPRRESTPSNTHPK